MFAPEMSEAAKQEERPSSGFFAIAQKIDDAVFTAEKAIVALSLITITVVVFVDVIARRITAPDSKIGQLISKIGGIEDFETREWVDANVAPWVTVVLALLVLGYGLFSARRFTRMRAETPPEINLGRELGLAAGFAVLGVAFGWGFALVFEQLESWMVYAATFAAGGIGFAIYSYLQRKDGWTIQVISGLVGGALLVWVSVAYVPEGYTWSKKVSLMLLLWVGLLSASICVYAGKHIRMGAAQKLLPDKARRWLNGTGFIATAGFCALMTFLGFMYVVAPKASDDEYMSEILTLGGTRWVYGFEGMIGREGFLEGTDIPDWLGIIAAPIGFGIATVRFIGAGISAFTGGSYGESAAEEGMEEAEQMAKASKSDEPDSKADKPTPKSDKQDTENKRVDAEEEE